jgi:acetyl-CoA acetyltransferase
MREVAVIGVGMTRFGKFLERSLKDLSKEATEAALSHAGVDKSAIQAAFVGNSAAGLITGQEAIRGQTVLMNMGIQHIPIINVENACASASTAFHLGWMMIASGMYDIVLALGMEKMHHEDKSRTFQALASGFDVDVVKWVMSMMTKEAGKETEEKGEQGKSRSIFMDAYAMRARGHVQKYGTTKEQFAKVSAKNHYNGSLNPYAQYQTPYTLEEVLNSRLIVEPLTLYMCSPIGDGAAAAILCSKELAYKYTTKPVFVAASVLGSGGLSPDPVFSYTTEMTSGKAYEMAGIGPEDIDVLEVHDAAAPGELIAYEELGLCPHGEGGRLIDEGQTKITGKIPVNTSGGLESKGHPIGATGLAQLAEIVWQLRGEADKRQVKEGKALVGMTHNAGGVMGNDEAAIAIHILRR